MSDRFVRRFSKTRLFVFTDNVKSLIQGVCKNNVKGFITNHEETPDASTTYCGYRHSVHWNFPPRPVSALCGTAYCEGTCPAPIGGSAAPINPAAKADIVLNNGAEDAGTLTALSGNAYSNQPADIETPTSEADAVTRILARSTALGR